MRQAPGRRRNERVDGGSAPTAIDLFAGCGGLTLGLKRGGFRVLSAVEVEPHAYATYRANHPEVSAYLQDIQTVKGSSLLGKRKNVSLVAGCPPCQGFSSLTSKWQRDDPRNELVDEMRRVVRELKPAMVMMENVPGLATTGRPILERFLRSLRAMGYLVTWKVLQVADYGVPQRRRRLVLLAGRGFDIPIPAPTHSRVPDKERVRWRTVRSAIGDMGEPIIFDEAKEAGGPDMFGWHVIRRMSSQNVRRLKHARPGAVWTKIPKRLRPDCHKGTDAGFRNTYGRLKWDEPSSTITGGCTSLSKGRFGHPTQLRTISVREAARLQTFPDSYVFDSPYIDYVCEMIGNALPCDFAEMLARQCVSSYSQRT